MKTEHTPAKLKVGQEVITVNCQGVIADRKEKDYYLVNGKWYYRTEILGLVTPAETKEETVDLNGNSKTVVPEPDNNSTFWNTPPVEDKGNKEDEIRMAFKDGYSLGYIGGKQNSWDDDLAWEVFKKEKLKK